jgi:methylmalonyl-CoA/ethylmalonyl-CoA epimerase
MVNAWLSKPPANVAARDPLSLATGARLDHKTCKLKKPERNIDMIGRLNHVAIAVPDLEAASAQYRNALGAKVGDPQDEPDHGVTVVFIELPNTKIELLYPLGDDSPINGFLEKNPSGGIHHVCYEVDDIIAARDHLKSTGARVLGSGEPKIGAHGKPVLFLHPKDFNGCLVELEQV